MKNLLAIIFIIFLSSSLYFFSLRGSVGNPLVDKSLTKISKVTGPFESSHERAPYALLVSLVKNKSFALSKELADFASPDTVFSGNKYFIIFPPGVSLIAIPFYKLGEPHQLAQLAAYWSMALYAILNLIVIYLITRNIFKLSIASSFLAALIFGFATTSWSFAASLYQHHLTVFLILSSFYAIWKYKHSTHKLFWSLWFWLTFGFSFWLDYPSVLLLIPLGIYLVLNSIDFKKLQNQVVISFKGIGFVGALAFILIIASHGYYNYVNFGSPTTLAQFLRRYDSSKVKAQSEKPLTSTALKETIKKKSSIANLFREDLLISGLNILTIAPDKGLFYFSPILLLAILSIFLIYKRPNNIKLEASILIGIFIVNLMMYSSWSDPWGGWAFGPRYLIPSMAILSIFVAYWLEKTKHQVMAKILAFIFLGYSIAIALLGVLTSTITPPKVEADYLKIKYGFFLNWDYFIDGKSGSFIFNEFASKFYSLQQYFLAIYIPLILIAFILLFIPPLFTKNQGEH